MPERRTPIWGWSLGLVLLLASAPAVFVFLLSEPAEARFAQIREGMTREEVLAIMGPALPMSAEDVAMWNDGKRVFIVWFAEDVVTDKSIQEPRLTGKESRK